MVENQNSHESGNEGEMMISRPPPTPPTKANSDTYLLPTMVAYESPALVHESSMVMYNPPAMLHELSLAAVLSNNPSRRPPTPAVPRWPPKASSVCERWQERDRPWATNRWATLHSVNYLLPNRIFTFSGDVQCKKCKKVSRLSMSSEASSLRTATSSRRTRQQFSIGLCRSG